ISSGVMQVVTDPQNGLFPLPGEMMLECSCPDWATMCKHVAAVLYGIGVRLDTQPEMLFLLRGVNHTELISTNIDFEEVASEKNSGRKRIQEGNLQEIFGIEFVEEKKREIPQTLPIANKSKTKPKKAPAKAKSLKKSETKTIHTQTPLTLSPFHHVTGEFVKKIRTQFEMTQKQFSTLLGIPPSKLSLWETTKGKISFDENELETWIRIAKMDQKQARKQLNLL
ncbi:MAG: SWIM zinc finger family protein, partial [Planctomycetota bacterium]